MRYHKYVNDTQLSFSVESGKTLDILSQCLDVAVAETGANKMNLSPEIGW